MSVTPAKKLMNDPPGVVNEYIEGLVETYPGLHYLEGFPQVKVVFRADIPCGRGTYDKVAVISGGCSDDEPAHAGFVGEGMLTAAICGDVFSSPPVDSILDGIRAVTGHKGCLLIVKNYTGDRLNFGLAAEEAKSEGFDVETVFVEDDCALPPPRGIAGRRGLAGTVLVQKVAGAAAAAGLSLADVAAEAKHASEVVGTMGVALHPCTLPGLGLADRLGPGKMEYGLGIHGEPGASVNDIQPVDEVVSHVLKEILSKETNYVPITPGSRVVLMINGLGVTPLMELVIAEGKAVPKFLVEHGMAVDRVYTGSCMTSLDMQGFSISIMRADPSILLRLDAETKAPYWPVAVEGNRPLTKLPVPIPPSRSAKSSEPRKLPLKQNEQGKLLKEAIEAGVNAIINLKDKLNEWDSAVGDGDCGSTILRAEKQILEDFKNYPLNDSAETFHEIGSSIGRSLGGTSGIIHTICKEACVQMLASSHSDVMPKKWAEALAAAIAAVKKYGKAGAGYIKLLDALIPALSTPLEKELDTGGDPSTAFIISSAAALDGAESTKHMIAKAGCATYVPEERQSVPDPGTMNLVGWHPSLVWQYIQVISPRKVASIFLYFCIIASAFMYSSSSNCTFEDRNFYIEMVSLMKKPSTAAENAPQTWLSFVTKFGLVCVIGLLACMMAVVITNEENHNLVQDGARRVIAKGQTGNIIFEGKYGGREVAIKALPPVDSVIALKEVSILEKVDNHPNIVRFYTSSKGSTEFWIGLERCGCNLGQLFESYQFNTALQNEKCSNFLEYFKQKVNKLWIEDFFPSPQLLGIMRDIARGLSELHQQDIIHGNLSVEHVLVTQFGTGFRGKLCSFGRSKEDVSQEEKEEDMYHVGLIFFECITCRYYDPPGEGFELPKKKKRFEISKIKHCEAKDLLLGLLENKDKPRLKAVDVIKHPIFWSAEQKVLFLTEASNRLHNEAPKSSPLDLLRQSSGNVFNGRWSNIIGDKNMLDNLKTYGGEPTSLKSLLRFVRGSHQHYRPELEAGTLYDNFYKYFSDKFPGLFMEVYTVIKTFFSQEPQFKRLFDDSTF
ncbi:putative 3,4-dihydroxy-2-butanone kinase [Lotus japonicus]|uniref:putative 3,4-dihydroxy-2-butanone kinase n=1 Tax=Lotus japonicus TaxID=34305 RepID=UPI00258C8A6E|nr:putative 3,4-dihydroxy-2-butanone kinase [Lotus japonicus]